ncbi:MAG: hypothetical protein ACKVHU_17170 [Acidimicrobiales bacterium]
MARRSSHTSDTEELGLVNELVSGTTPETIEHGGRLGLRTDVTFDYWVNGRTGVLGYGDAAKAAAGIAFTDPNLVRDYWEGRPPSLPAMVAAWGSEALHTMAEERSLGRLIHAARRW